MINITSFIGAYFENEQKVNNIYKSAAMSRDLNKIKAAKELMINIENQAIVRITSSNFNLAFEALK